MPSGCILYTAISVPCCRPANKVSGVLYTTSAWGFRVARFYCGGQCEGLDAWNERQSTVPTLFLLLIFSGGEQGEKRRKIMETAIGNIPPRVFKFYSLNNNSIDAFLNHYLFLSHPYHLNDLMDTYGYAIDTRNITPEIYNKLKNQIINHTPLMVNGVDFSKLDFEIDRGCEVLRKAISDSYFCFGGIVSLSSINRFNELMWSHYTNETGFMIEFDTLALLRSIKFHKLNNHFKTLDIRPINYKPNPTGVSCVQHPDIEYINITNATQKKDDWTYENEWRIIATSYNFLGLPKSLAVQDEKYLDVSKRRLYYDPSSIMRIFLGKKFFEIHNVEKVIPIGDHYRQYIIQNQYVPFFKEIDKCKNIYMSGSSDIVKCTFNVDEAPEDTIERAKTESNYFSERSFEPIKQFIADGKLILVEYSRVYIE